MVRNRQWKVWASIVLTGAILALIVSRSATTDVNISSTAGTTNVVRSIITNSVGSGKLLLVIGTNIYGISTNNFGPSNAITSVTINFSGSGVGGTVINPIFADSTNALWALDGSFTDVHLHLTNISEKQLTLLDNITNNASTTKHGFLQKLSGNTNSVFKGDGNESTNLYGIGAINANNGQFTNSLLFNGVQVITNIPAVGLANTLTKWVTTNLLSYIPNGVGILTNDGAGNFGWTTNINQDITVNNITTTNVTANNTYVVNGKNNTLIITNALSLLSLSTNKLLRMGADGVVTNIANGSGVLTNDGSGNFTWTTNVGSSGGGSSGSTNYRSSRINLTITGTNIDANQIDWLKTNQCYRITCTTNVFFGDAVCINVPDTNSFQWLQLEIVQDSTGGRTVTFTNSIFAGVNGTFAISSQTNAWDSLTMVNSPQTNGNIAVLPSNYLHR